MRNLNLNYNGSLLTASVKNEVILEDFEVNPEIENNYKFGQLHVFVAKNGDLKVFNADGKVMIEEFSPCDTKESVVEHLRFIEFRHYNGTIQLVCKNKTFSTGFYQPRVNTRGFQINHHTLRCLKLGYEVQDFDLI